MGIVQTDPSKSGLSKRIKADSLELKDTPEGMGEGGNYSGAKNQAGLEKHLFLVHAFHTCRLMSYLNILFCSPTQEISNFFYIKKKNSILGSYQVNTYLLFPPLVFYNLVLL